MRFLLDEHLSPRIAAGLRDRGHDAVSVAERIDLTGLPDDRLWKAAIGEGRAVVTCNVRDFAILVGHEMAIGGSHAGLVLVSSRAFSPSIDGTGRMVTALDRLAAAHEDGIDDRVAWLAPDEP